MDIKKNQILNYALHGDLDSLIQSKLEGDFHWSRCVNKSTGDTPIHLAAQNNHVAVLQFLCEKWLPCNIELCNKDGKRAMHFAAQHHNYETIIYLITKGANVNATNGLGYTCLHLAAQSGHAEIIVFLVRDLDQRVNTISNADECKTPLHCAGRSKNADIFDLLISLGADKNVLDVHKRTAEYYLLL